MTARTHSKQVVFSKPFLLTGVGRPLPAGDYRVVTDEELIEGLSFPVYRRTSTMMFVPSQSHPASEVEMITIDPLELAAAQDRDASPRAPTSTPRARSCGRRAACTARRRSGSGARERC